MYLYEKNDQMAHKNYIGTKITDKMTKWEMRADYFLVARVKSRYLCNHQTSHSAWTKNCKGKPRNGKDH